MSATARFLNTYPQLELTKCTGWQADAGYLLGMSSASTVAHEGRTL